MRILHVTTTLAMGGAQTALLRLIEHTPEQNHRVVSLRGGIASFTTRLAAAGVGFETALNPLALARVGRAWAPDVVMGWMYHGALAAYAARLGAAKACLIWNIRHDPGDDLRHEKPFSRLVIRAGAALSPRIDRIVYNSQSSATRHVERFGYARPPTRVIRNGFDLDRFRRRPAAREEVRRRLGLDPASFVVGSVACNRPQKNLALLVEAARRLRAIGCPVELVLVGTGTERLGGAPGVRALGERTDVEDLLQAFDGFVLSSSWGESTPNAVAEAMANELVVVTTAVGGAPELVGDTGLLVPAGDAAALAGAIREVAAMPAAERAQAGARARARIVENYAMSRMVEGYRRLWQEVPPAATRRSGPALVLRRMDRGSP